MLPGLMPPTTMPWSTSHSNTFSGAAQQGASAAGWGASHGHAAGALVDLNRLPNQVLPYTITDASSYQGKFHPNNIIVDDPTNSDSRWAPAYVNNSASWSGSTAGAGTSAAASALAVSAGIPHAPASSGHTSPSPVGSPYGPVAAQAHLAQKKHYLLLRLSSPAVLRTIRFGKYYKSHTTTMREFKIYAGPTKHAASMTRILRDSCRDDSKAQDFPCRYTDDDGVPFVVRYVRIEPLNSHGVLYNFSIWHVALFGISEPHVVQRVQHEYEVHRDTKSTRLILKHLRARAHQSAFRSLLLSSNLGRPLKLHEHFYSLKRLRDTGSLIGRGPRPFEHPLLSSLFRALTRRDAWDDVERILDLAAYGEPADGTIVEVSADMEGDDEDRQNSSGSSPLSRRAGKDKAADAGQDTEGEVLFAHFVSRTVPRSVWTPMPVRKALPSADLGATPPTGASGLRPSPFNNSAPPRNAPARPGPRAGHQMVLDTTKSIVYLFGGWDGVQDLADFWAYDIERATWRCISMDTSQPVPRQADESTAYPYGLGTAGPTARSCHQMVFDPRTGCIYLLGRFVEFPAALPTRSATTVNQQPQARSANAGAASSSSSTARSAATGSGNQAFQDVFIPTRDVRSQIATTTTSNAALARPASTAALQNSAQLSAAASALAAGSLNPTRAADTTSSASSSGANQAQSLVGGGHARFNLGTGNASSRHIASQGSSSLNPSPAPRAVPGRNLASPGAPTSRSQRAAELGYPASAQAQTSFVHRSGDVSGNLSSAALTPPSLGAGGANVVSRTLPGYESDFWRFSTRTQTWTRLSADTSADDGTGSGNPGPRLVKDHALCIDSEEQVLYLFGGRVAHPNPSVLEYGGMWRYDIIRRTWVLLFNDEMHKATGGGCIAGREGHSMLFDPNGASPSLVSQSSTNVGRSSTHTGTVAGMAAALSASRSGPGALLWVIGGRRDLFLADMSTYNIRTGVITHVTACFTIPYGPKAAFTPQVLIDPRPSKREIYFLSALDDRDPPGLGGDSGTGAGAGAGAGSAGQGEGGTSSLKMWVYSIERKTWTSVLEPEAASTNAVLAATAAAAAGGTGGGVGGDGVDGVVAKPSVRIGQAGAGFEMDTDEYGLRSAGGSSLLGGGAGVGSGIGGAGAAPKRQRRRDTLESECDADEDARARLMLSSPPPTGPLHALPFPSTSARRDEAMMMLMESEADVDPLLGGGSAGERRAGGGYTTTSSGDNGSNAAGAGPSASAAAMAHSAALYAGLEPRPRWAAQMVYDPQREAFYLFGGNPSGGEAEPPLAPPNNNASSAAADVASSSASMRVRSRLDDWWRLVLVRPSVDEVLRRTKFLVRKQRFLEMAAGSWESSSATQPSMSSVPSGSGPTEMDMSASEMGASGFLGGGASGGGGAHGGMGLAGPRAVEALLYLQTQVSAVVDHADEAESHDFRRLMSKLLAGGGLGGGGSAGAMPAMGGLSTPTPFAPHLGDTSVDVGSGDIGAAPSHPSSGTRSSLAHRRKMRKKNERRRRRSHREGAALAEGSATAGAASMDVDMAGGQQETQPTAEVPRGSSSVPHSPHGDEGASDGESSLGSDEEEDEDPDDSAEEHDVEDDHEDGAGYGLGRSLMSDEWESERELLVGGREGAPSALWTQRVRLFRTLLDYFPPDCVEPRADLVDLTTR